MKGFTGLGTHSAKTLVQTLALFQLSFFNKELIMRSFFKWALNVLVAGLIGGLLAIMFLEWAAGCGESYIDAKGVTHSNECIIINHN